MTTVVKSPHSSEQIAAWLRGLLTIAWADGDFNQQEQELIATLTREGLDSTLNFGNLEAITPEELAAGLGQDQSAAENFLRTAVMVAIADGIYSVCENNLLYQFCQALKQPPAILEVLQQTLCDQQSATPSATLIQLECDALRPVRNWLDGLEVDDPRVARFLCRMIPAQCPFERDVKLFGQKIVHIPPLCKINPSTSN